MAAISAHRRDSDDEGLALKRAVASGAEYVELDIRTAFSGEPVVRHDRLAGAGRYFGVRAALEILQGRAVAHLDLKEQGGELEIVRLAQEVSGPDGFVVTTKIPSSIAAVKKEFPTARCALSVGRSFWERGVAGDLLPISKIRACGADWVALNYRLAQLGVLRQCADAGFPAMIWTVNRDRDLRRFLTDPRVAVVITDRPADALRIRAAL
ncbi:MAG: glycerophosphodiester phosphodiesterase [Streptosporangiaceae bacterium]